MEKLLTPKQLSELLQVNLKTVYWWTQTGFIPHLKFGKLVRFKWSEVEQWQNERSRKGRKTLKYDIINVR